MEESLNKYESTKTRGTGTPGVEGCAGLEGCDSLNDPLWLSKKTNSFSKLFVVVSMINYYHNYYDKNLSKIKHAY